MDGVTANNSPVRLMMTSTVSCCSRSSDWRNRTTPLSRSTLNTGPEILNRSLLPSGSTPSQADNWYTTLPTGVFSSRLNRAMSPLPGIKCGVRLMICARAHCCSSTSTSSETSFTLGYIILVHECTAMVCSAPARAASEPASTGLEESSSDRSAARTDRSTAVSKPAAAA
uniref:Uncharacterized protein n=1 Tax=Anopheles coluzzii TaxID=1518534 RepID=A0A8W7PZG6_ANOCL